ncbi:hypothetical protein HDU93_004357, partial [Gonapodya sp. JEL0774]
MPTSHPHPALSDPAHHIPESHFPAQVQDLRPDSSQNHDTATDTPNLDFTAALSALASAHTGLVNDYSSRIRILEAALAEAQAARKQAEEEVGSLAARLATYDASWAHRYGQKSAECANLRSQLASTLASLNISRSETTRLTELLNEARSREVEARTVAERNAEAGARCMAAYSRTKRMVGEMRERCEVVVAERNSIMGQIRKRVNEIAVMEEARKGRGVSAGGREATPPTTTNPWAEIEAMAVDVALTVPVWAAGGSGAAGTPEAQAAAGGELAHMSGLSERKRAVQEGERDRVEGGNTGRVEGEQGG